VVVKGKRVAVLDWRSRPTPTTSDSSPALEVVNGCWRRSSVHATDPEAMSRAKHSPQVNYHKDPYDVLREADAALVCTEWDVLPQTGLGPRRKSHARKLVD